jgi:hypothetical protein
VSGRRSLCVIAAGNMATPYEGDVYAVSLNGLFTCTTQNRAVKSRCGSGRLSQHDVRADTSSRSAQVTIVMDCHFALSSKREKS